MFTSYANLKSVSLLSKSSFLHFNPVGLENAIYFLTCLLRKHNENSSEECRKKNLVFQNICMRESYKAATTAQVE